jgi:CheY-like chemotaxis protein
MRALVVEDESKMAALLRRGLQEEGFAVDSAANGEDGSWMGTENDYDVILLDVMLPDVDGFEVCRRLRAADRWAPDSRSSGRSPRRTAARRPPATSRGAVPPSRSRCRSDPMPSDIGLRASTSNGGWGRVYRWVRWM